MSSSSLPFNLFQRVVIQNKALHNHIFNYIQIVNRFKNNPPSNCNCTKERGGHKVLDEIERYHVQIRCAKIFYPSLTKYIECNGDKEWVYDYGYQSDQSIQTGRTYTTISMTNQPQLNRLPRYCKIDSMTLEWCCRFGTPSLLYDLLSSIYNNLVQDEEIDPESPSKVNSYIRNEILDIHNRIGLIQVSLKCGNLEILKYLFQIFNSLFKNEYLVNDDDQFLQLLLFLTDSNNSNSSNSDSNSKNDNKNSCMSRDQENQFIIPKYQKEVSNREYYRFILEMERVAIKQLVKYGMEMAMNMVMLNNWISLLVWIKNQIKDSSKN